MALCELAKAWLFEACCVKLGFPSIEVALANLSNKDDQLQAMAAVFGKYGPGSHGTAHFILLKDRL